MGSNFVDTLFRNETDSVFIQLFRYAIVGGLAFIADFGSLFILTEVFDIQYLVSASIGFVIGLVVNYLLSIQWVFNHKETNRNRGSEFLGWFVIGIAGLGLNALIMWFFTDILSLFYLISKFISTIIVFAWNFFARRFLMQNF